MALIGVADLLSRKECTPVSPEPKEDAGSLLSDSRLHPMEMPGIASSGTQMQGVNCVVEASESCRFGDLLPVPFRRRSRKEPEDTFDCECPPQHFIEVEGTYGDTGKPAVCRDPGVGDRWQIDAHVKFCRSADVPDLQHADDRRPVMDSHAFPGITTAQLTHLLRDRCLSARPAWSHGSRSDRRR